MNTPSSRQYILDLLAQGNSYASIGRQLGRDGSLIRQISLGKKPGTNLNDALGELSTTGQVRHVPYRRTTSAGGLAKVRGKKGDESRIPSAPPGQRIRTASKAADQPEEQFRRAAQEGRNLLRHEVNRHPNGSQFHRITVPKRLSSANRKSGNEIVRDVLNTARGEGRRFSATVWADIERKDGTKAKIPIALGGTGGYTAQAAFDAIEADSSGDGFGWFQGQVSRRYPKGTFKSMVITGIDLNTW